MTRKILSLGSLLIINLTLIAQSINEPRNLSPQWSQSYQSYRMVGNVYYVGTYDLACYLIVTKEGNILINTGLAASTKLIKENIESLGFRLNDIKILLTTQVHYDHVGAMAEIKKLSGAKMVANEKDAGVLIDGGSSDYELGKNGKTFAPVDVDRNLKDGDTILLGDMKIVMLHHPGHTKGSSSYLLNVTDEKKTYKVIIANMPTIVTDRKFNEIPQYPTIEADFAETFKALRKQTFDLWLSSHANQFNMHSKHKPGDAYNPEVFADREGYDKSLDDLEARYRKKLSGN